MRNLEIKNQNGRSMIEMLGVLAIIGVLSVGGIAGYSKAMMKYRINKAIEQISIIAANVQSFYASQKDFTDLSNTILLKAKLVPDEMWNEAKTGLVNPLGGSYYSVQTDVDYNKGFNIIMFDISQEACIELATQDWSAITGSGFDYVAISNDQDLVYGVYGGPKTGKGVTDGATYIIAGPNSDITEISLEQAANICSSVNNNNFGIGFKK